MGWLSSAWTVRDEFGVAWRLRVVSESERPGKGAQLPAEYKGPIERLMYFAFDSSGVRGDEHVARALLEVYDRLTGESFAERVPNLRSDTRGLLRDLDRELPRAMLHAAAAGRLRIEAVAPRRWPFPDGPEAPAPVLPVLPVEETPPAFVALRLLDQDKNPVPRRGLHLALADGSTREGFFDGRGAFRLDDVPEGKCMVTLDDLDPREFFAPVPLPGKDTGEETGPVEVDDSASAGRVYAVEPCDTLSSIADRFGFLHFATVWNDPANAGLRAVRASPHVLLAGDEVVVPDKRPRKLSVMTNTEITLIVYVEKLHVKLRAVDASGEPVDVDPASVQVNGAEAAASPAGDVLDTPIARDAVTLSLVSTDSEPKEASPLLGDIGALPPLREVGGAQARLENLGFGMFDDPPAEDDDPDADEALELAIELFQESLGRTPDSDLTDQVLADLQDRAGA